MVQSSEQELDIAGIADALERHAKLLRRMVPANSERAGTTSKDPVFRFGNGGAYGRHRDERYADLAKKEYDRRAIRAKLFPTGWFAEPAWDILLDLFINWERETKVYISDGCIAARVPPTTGLRWIELLIAEGVVERKPIQNDKRMVEIRLTDKGLQKVREYFYQVEFSGR